MVPLSFAGEMFQASRDGALFHAASQSLIVADLHLEKASFYAASGQFLPPYDSRATLTGLTQLATRTKAKRIFCLGDNYHDSAGETRLSDEDAAQLCRLSGTCEILWIVGNHDPDLAALHGGEIQREARLGSIRLRHNVGALGEGEAEISGHYHPQFWLSAGRRRRIRRACFVTTDDRLILPAFGALTGGMNAADPAIAKALGHKRREALVVLDDRLCNFALDGEQQTNKRQA